MPSRLTIASKALMQLGSGPLLRIALYRLALWSGYYRARPDGSVALGWGDGSTARLHPLFKLPSRELLSETLGVPGRSALIEEANEIVEGRARLFGGEAVPLSLGIEGPLLHWTAYERDPGLLARHYPQFSDVKFLWEPARFGFAFVLGRAFRLSGDEGYAEAFWRLFEAFHEANAPFLGPNWMNGQEVAIRLLALVWADQVFADSTHSTPSRRARIHLAVAQHAARVHQTFIYARAQNNNHVVTEAAAMFTAGLALEEPRWRRAGWRWLNWAFANQISDYGEYIQHSTNYHRLVLQAALWVTAILSQRGQGWPARTTQALQRASHWLFSVLDPDTGRTPNLGANDGALILPLSTGGIADHRPTVQAAARAFLRTQLPSGPWDEMSVWLGIAGQHQVRQSDQYLAENPRGRTSWGYLRASQFRSRLGHMDQLHFDLWWRGLNVAQDAGTFLYNDAPPWNNPLVSAMVHNTVTVDGRDQMTRGGRFLVLDWFPAYVRAVLQPDGNVLSSVTAQHRGYRGVRHRRTVSVLAGEVWHVRDELTSTRTRTYRLHWLVADWEWSVRSTGAAAELDLKSPNGPVTLTLESDSPGADGPARLSIVRAGQVLHGKRAVSAHEGWASPTYGHKGPALSLAFELRAPGSVLLTTTFRLAP